MANSNTDEVERELRLLRRERTKQAAEYQRLVQEMRINEEARKRHIREIQVQHEEELRQAHAAQRVTRIEIQELEREQEIEDDDEPDDLEIRSHRGTADSVFAPEDYKRRMPIGMSRTADRVVQRQTIPKAINFTAGELPLEDFVTIEATGVQLEKSDHGGTFKEIEEMDRRLMSLRRQGLNVLDASREAKESESHGMNKSTRRKLSFQIAEKEEETVRCKTPVFSESTPQSQKYHYPSSIEKEQTGGIYEEPDDFKQMPAGFTIDGKGFKTQRQERYKYFPPEDTTHAESMRYQTQQQRESYRHREPPLRETEEDITYKFDDKRRRVVESLIAWEEEIRRREIELDEREKRLTLETGRLDQEYSTRDLLEKEEALKKRQEIIQIRDEELMQRETMLGRRRNEMNEIQRHKDFSGKVSINRLQERESTIDTQQQINTKYKADSKVPESIPSISSRNDGDSTDKMVHKQNVLDTKYLFPKFTIFSGGL